MEELLKKINMLANSSDDAGRQEIMESLHKLAYSMERPEDTRDRFSFLHLRTAVVKTGFDLGIFAYLAGSRGAMTENDMSQKTGAQCELMGRILRFLAAIGAVDEVGPKQYVANTVTQNLTQRATQAGVNHWFCTVSPQYQQLPKLLKETGYLNPVDETHTAFHEAWSTSVSPLAWFEDKPELLNHFNEYMATRARIEHSWLQVYPVLEEAKDCSADRALYVNVGGGIGHQCAEFKEKFPDLPGRIILQDLQHSISQALATPGVENMVHDFFDIQPIQGGSIFCILSVVEFLTCNYLIGARFYYLRAVLHDHPRHKVSKIIQNIKVVMAQDSVLLVDEMILPETSVNAFAASVDMSMLTAFASMERTEAQWRTIFDEEGLKVANTRIYNPLTYEGVLDVRLR